MRGHPSFLMQKGWPHKRGSAVLCIILCQLYPIVLQFQSLLNLGDDTELTDNVTFCSTTTHGEIVRRNYSVHQARGQ